MGKQATAQPRRQYLDVKYTMAPDGTHMPYSISMDDEQYPVEVLRSKEILPAKWRHTVRVKEVELYLFREGDVWWME